MIKVKENKRKDLVNVTNMVSGRKVAALWLRGLHAQGLDYQERVCKEFAMHYGISIKKSYGCIGLSPELLNNMVSEVTQDEKINVVLVFSEDRLSRKESEVLELKALLKAKGVDLISVAPNNKQSKYNNKYELEKKTKEESRKAS